MYGKSAVPKGQQSCSDEAGEGGFDSYSITPTQVGIPTLHPRISLRANTSLVAISIRLQGLIQEGGGGWIGCLVTPCLWVHNNNR